MAHLLLLFIVTLVLTAGTSHATTLWRSSGSDDLLELQHASAHNRLQHASAPNRLQHASHPQQHRTPVPVDVEVVGIPVPVAIATDVTHEIDSVAHLSELASQLDELDALAERLRELQALILRALHPDEWRNASSAAVRARPHPPEADAVLPKKQPRDRQQQQQREKNAPKTLAEAAAAKTGPDAPFLVYPSASSSASLDTGPNEAFDGDLHTAWVSRPFTDANGTKEAWLEYTFDRPQRITNYTLAAPLTVERKAFKTAQAAVSALQNAVSRGPHAWRVRCSEDGVAWTQVHRVRRSTKPWMPGQRRTFKIAQHARGPYRYCRLVIDGLPQGRGGVKQVAVGELTFGRGGRPSLTKRDKDVHAKSAGPPKQPKTARKVTTISDAKEAKPGRCAFPFEHMGASHEACFPFKGVTWCKDDAKRWLVCGAARGESTEEPANREGEPGDEDVAERSKEEAPGIALVEAKAMRITPGAAGKSGASEGAAKRFEKKSMKAFLDAALP